MQQDWSLGHPLRPRFKKSAHLFIQAWWSWWQLAWSSETKKKFKFNIFLELKIYIGGNKQLRLSSDQRKDLYARLLLYLDIHFPRRRTLLLWRMLLPCRSLILQEIWALYRSVSNQCNVLKKIFPVYNLVWLWFINKFIATLTRRHCLARARTCPSIDKICLLSFIEV